MLLESATNNPPTNFEHAGSGNTDCQCNRIDDWCGKNNYCGNSDYCKKTNWGCGWWLWERCDGWCYSKDWVYNGTGNNSVIIIGEKYKVCESRVKK